MLHPLRPPTGWRPILAITLPALAIVGVLVFLVTHAHPPSPTSAVAAGGATQPQLPPPAGLMVDVSGAVANPGLYRLSRGDRVREAIAAAGGLTAAADSTRLPNMAGRLRDGQQVRVPFAKSPGGARAGATPRVNLNQATAEELAQVPGFTPDLTQAVVAHRSSYGPFSSTSELVTLLGMSRAGYASAKPHLTI